MTLRTITQPRNALTRVHSVTHDGTGYINLLMHFSSTDKGLYKQASHACFRQFRFCRVKVNRVHQRNNRTEKTQFRCTQ